MLGANLGLVLYGDVSSWNNILRLWSILWLVIFCLYSTLSLLETFHTKRASETSKISRCQDFIKHLSGLQSKQHEVQLLQQLLHTCINKTKKQKEWEHTILHFRSIFQTPNSRYPFHTLTHAHIRQRHPRTHTQAQCNIYE